MTREVWFNLPVKDLGKAKAFYRGIGFVLSEHGYGALSAGFKIGAKNMVMMLFEEPTFARLSGAVVSDTHAGAEIMMSVDAESREEIDLLAEQVIVCGGRIFAQPDDSQGWMYGFGFQDPDGHRWNAVYMDYKRISLPG